MFELNYTANATFSQVHQDISRFIFVMGPVGSGKSSGCVMHCWLNALKQIPQYDGVRRSRYAIIRATYPNLKSTTIRTWEYWFKSLFTPVFDTPIRAVMRMAHPDRETTIEMELYFIALDRPEEVNKLQSLEVTGAHINEAHEIPQEVFQMLKSRYNRYPLDKVNGIVPVDPFIIADYNATPTDHWLYTLSEESKPPKHSFYRQLPALLRVAAGESDITDSEGNYYVLNTEADNVDKLPDDYYQDQVYGADAEWVSVMILNNYGNLRAGKPVYPQYRDQIHFTNRQLKPMLGVPLIIGMDLGLTPAATFTQLTPTGQLVVLDELVTENTSIQEFCNNMLKPHLINHYKPWIRNYQVVIDKSAGARNPNDKTSGRDIVKGSGLKVKLSISNEITKRRESVIYFLRRIDGFLIGPKCPTLRKGFLSEYHYPRVLNVIKPKYKEEPEKNIYSHVHDALQYAALEFSEGRLALRPRNTPQFSVEYSTPDEAGY